MITLTFLEITLSCVVIVLFIICLLLSKKNFSLSEELRNERKFFKSQEQLEDRFKNLSSEILISNHKNFLNLAKETLEKVIAVEKNDLDKKQMNFVNLVKPIQETLSNFDHKVSDIEKARTDAYSELRQQVKDLMLYQQELQKETSALNKALSNPLIT